MLAHQHLLDLIAGLFRSSVDPVLVGASVYRQRRRPIAAEVTKAVSVRLVRSQAHQVTIQPLDWSTLIAVEYTARAAASQSADEAVGPLIDAGHQLLVGDNGLQQAGFELMPDATLDWDEDELQERLGVCTAIYQVRHRTGFLNLSA